VKDTLWFRSLLLPRRNKCEEIFAPAEKEESMPQCFSPCDEYVRGRGVCTLKRKPEGKSLCGCGAR